MRKKLILFTRTPSLGNSKSRLSLVLNERERLELTKGLLNFTFREIKKTGLSYSIHYEGKKEDIIYLSEKLIKQEGADLGDRMFNAIKNEFLTSDSVVLVGSDLLGLNAKYIENAFKALENNDLVLGPTEDGGYGLVGMNKPLDVFSNISYSQTDVLEMTLKKAKDLGAKAYLLEVIRDIDTPEDLVREEISAKEVELLGYGEYNINYKYDNDFVFRINLASQLNLGDEQIIYEYQALKQLEDSGVTPRVFQVKKRGSWIKKGYLTMEYLQGRPLDYNKDLEIAAYLLAKIHNHKFEKREMIFASQPFRLMYEEFLSMFAHYKAWENKDKNIEAWIEKLLRIAKSLGLDNDISRPCIINTELNNRNFIIGSSREDSFVIDWEKPIVGDCEQDLAHFCVPTTTNWKTNKIFSKNEINQFLDFYEAYRKVDRKLFDKYFIFNCLRGITWCSMAKVEYSGKRFLTNSETLKKINLFISEDFIEYIYKEFYEVYDVK